MPSPSRPVARVHGCARLRVNPAVFAETDAPSQTVAYTQTALLPPYLATCGHAQSRVCVLGGPACRLAHIIGAMGWERGGRAMYMNAGANEFGAWPTAAAGPTGIRFSLFFPNPTQFVTANKPADYGDPQIASIDVIGSFQTALGQQPFTPGAGTRLAAAPHASGKGTVYSLT